MRAMTATIPFLAMSIACGASRAPENTPSRVDFTYEMEGAIHRLSEMRRRPLMLVLMRTSDIVSQIYMKEVAEVFSKRAGRLRMVVLTVEPTEKPFVDAYARFEKLPFPIGVAEASLALGGSALGVVPALPMTYLIDSSGKVVYSEAGVISSEAAVSEIDDLLDI